MARFGTTLLLAGLLLPVHPALAAREPQAHPLHTTLMEIGEAAGGRATILLRVFTEDFANASLRSPGRTLGAVSSVRISDSAAMSYLRSALTLTDRTGAVLALTWAGSRQQGDVTFISLTVSIPRGLSGLMVRDAVNCELFEDQVNIVKATYSGRSESLLFTRGDDPKPLP
jgi:hypothetical protein